MLRPTHFHGRTHNPNTLNLNPHNNHKIQLTNKTHNKKRILLQN